MPGEPNTNAGWSPPWKGHAHPLCRLRHYAYYGRTGNGKRLEWFRYQVARIWRKWLARRSRRRCLNWDRMNEILKRYPLPSVNPIVSIE